jgi:hypothetical protein
MSTFDVNNNSLGHGIDKEFSMDLNKSYGKFKLSNIEDLLSKYLKVQSTNIKIVTGGYFTSEVMYACDMYVEIYSEKYML